MKRKSNNIFIFLAILVSYIFSVIYTPFHITQMNSDHDMNMPKEECPFVISDNILCNSIIKKDSNSLSQINNILINTFSYSFLFVIAIITLLYYLKSIFIKYLLQKNNRYKIPILFKELFSSGILNPKTF